jgi:hypothetical protein
MHRTPRINVSKLLISNLFACNFCRSAFPLALFRPSIRWPPFPSWRGDLTRAKKVKDDGRGKRRRGETGNMGNTHTRPLFAPIILPFPGAYLILASSYRRSRSRGPSVLVGRDLPCVSEGLRFGFMLCRVRTLATFFDTHTRALRVGTVTDATDNLCLALAAVRPESHVPSHSAPYCQCMVPSLNSFPETICACCVQNLVHRRCLCV